MNRKICNSIGLSTHRANGDLIDHQEYDGTVTAAQNVADDIANFQNVWEHGERYELFVNGIVVDVVLHNEVQPVDHPYKDFVYPAER